MTASAFQYGRARKLAEEKISSMNGRRDSFIQSIFRCNKTHLVHTAPDRLRYKPFYCSPKDDFCHAVSDFLGKRERCNIFCQPDIEIRDPGLDGKRHGIAIFIMEERRQVC